MNNYKIVIAKYKEDMGWVHRLNQPNVIIYDKSGVVNKNSIPLPNIGRESETFIRYIIENYDSLSEYTFFLQGDPFPHMKNVDSNNLQDKINDFLSNPKEISPAFCDIYYEKADYFPDLCVRQYYKHLFGEACPEIVEFAAGCQYIVNKNRILSRPKQFYSDIHAMLLLNKVTDVGDVIGGHSFSGPVRNIPFDKLTMNPWTFERMAFKIFT